MPVVSLFVKPAAHLGRRVHGEAELGLLAVVDGEALKQEGSQAGAGTATHCVEDKEALEPRAVVRQLADAVQAQVHDLLHAHTAAKRLEGDHMSRDGYLPEGKVKMRLLVEPRTFNDWPRPSYLLKAIKLAGSRAAVSLEASRGGGGKIWVAGECHLANGVVTTGEVVGSILLARDQLLCRQGRCPRSERVF